MAPHIPVYLKRLAFFPLASGLASVAGIALRPWFLWKFEEQMARAAEEARERGAPRIEVPSRGRIVRFAALLGAGRGLGFALVRPALPRRPETAGLVFSTLVGSTLGSGAAGIEQVIRRDGFDPGFNLSLGKAVRALAPRVLYHAGLIAAIERAITR